MHFECVDKPFTPIPQQLSEIQDLLGSMIGSAPTFVSKARWAQNRTLDSEFNLLVEALLMARDQLGEPRYARAITIASEAKALFLDDPEDTNGNTVIGCHLLWDIDDIVEEARDERRLAEVIDDNGHVTYD